MNMIHDLDVLETENLSSLFEEAQALVFRVAHDQQPVHEVEKALWQQMLLLGHHLLAKFFALSGTGDVGPIVTLPNGEVSQRLEGLHPRRYVSIFGEFRLQRVVYGSREKQKIDCVPLDSRWQLPQSVFSYVLQDWDQALCVEQAFGQAKTTVGRILGLKPSVDSLEHMNQEMLEQAPWR